MKIAYLINQYPKVSHSFIRREIQALEKLGVVVSRFSIRQVSLDSLVDEQDIAEHDKTIALLAFDISVFLRALMQSSVKSAYSFCKALAIAISLGRKNRRGILRHLAYFVEACVLKEQLINLNIEHVHAHFGTNSATVAMLCRFLGGPPFSFTVHGPEEFDDPEGLALKEKIQHSHFVVAISDFGRGQLMRWCPYEMWEKIKVVHCSVDDSFFRKSNTPVSSVPRLVCVGRLCAQKGQLLLLEALHQIDNGQVGFELVFAGDGEMRGALENLIKDYDLEGKTRITGWISGDQVKEEILASRIMVLPSFAEGLPVVIMEAFALQRPVISTYVAGIPELVEQGKNGWLVPSGSIRELAITLREALSATTEQLTLMGETGADAVRKRHNAMVEAKKLLAYFKDEYH